MKTIAGEFYSSCETFDGSSWERRQGVGPVPVKVSDRKGERMADRVNTNRDVCLSIRKPAAVLPFEFGFSGIREWR